jgi:YHS domain-containing protein
MTRFLRPLLAAFVALAALAASRAMAENPVPPPPPRANAVCPVDGKPFKPEVGLVAYRREGIAFCGPACRDAFMKAPVPYMERMRKDPAAYAYKSRWPAMADLVKAKASVGSANGLCPVSDQPVRPEGGCAMYQGQKICIRCKCCVEKFTANPEAFMAKMRADPSAYAYDMPTPVAR